MLETFQKKVAAKKARVGVVGLGYVGLPLALAFASRGFRVTGIDLDQKKISALGRGESYILDVPPSQVREALKRASFSPTADYKSASQLDALILCVPTPLSKTKEPDISFVLDSAGEAARHLKKGQLIVLESTTYPGTTEDVVRPVLEKSGLFVERDFFLAFSPERVDPGNKVYDTSNIPKVVGGAGPRSFLAAKCLYESVVKSVVGVSSARAAEMTKLLENTFRSVNIALINEMALLSSRMGIDIWEVIEAAKTKPFGFMPFYPGPGIGGHCLPIDPLYLSWKSRTYGFEAKMIELASSINAAMPLHVVEKIRALLNQKKTPLKDARILVLGASYKKNVNDARESPALELMEHLLKEKARVSYCDPYIPSLKLNGASLKAQRLTPEILKKQDCVAFLTDHSSFDGAMIAKHSKLILDTRNVLRKYTEEAKGKLFFL